MLTCSPTIAFFAVLQSISNTRYLFQKKLDNLQTDTFLLYHLKNKDKLIQKTDIELLDSIESIEDISEELKRKINSFERKIKILKCCSSNLIMFLLIFLFTIVT